MMTGGRVLLMMYSSLLVSCVLACYRGGAQPSVRATTSGLRAALGGNLAVSPYTTRQCPDSITAASDLNCDMNEPCEWYNDGNAKLAWQTGSGQPDDGRWQTATRTTVIPTAPFLMLASNPRGTADSGLLISCPVPCQQTGTSITFNHWQSLSHKAGQEAKLDVCYRYIGQTQLLGCQTVRNASPGPTTFNFPAMTKKFEYVFKAYNFVNSPEGGFVAVDNIAFNGRIGGQGAACSAITTNAASTNGSNQQSCQLLMCQHCSWKPVGQGANGIGLEGWRTTTGNTNSFNPLTGIHRDPNGNRGHTRITDGYFAVADFPDYTSRKTESLSINERDRSQYSLQSADLTFTQTNFLRFQRYIATEGTQMKICRDSEGRNCLYKSQPLTHGTGADQNRLWQAETVQLPPGSYKLYALTGYDGTQRYFTGQVGIAQIEVYTDNTLSTKVC